MIVLSSGSPRRKSLLERIGVKYIEYTPCIDEGRAEETPRACTMRLAKEKALKGAEVYPEDVIISADTVVVIDGEILGKPSDRKDAVKMLRRLSGRTHEVITGICVKGRKCEVRAVHTLVKFRALTDAEILSYVSMGESDDKAGGYGVQGKGSLLIEGITGDYYNVVGLPLSTLYDMLQSEGINLL